MMKRTTKQLLAVGYIRVSTNGQVENGISLQAQHAKIRAWAEANDAELLNIFNDEGLSGSTTDRPGLQQALQLVTEHKAVLVVYSLSRFSRSTRDTLQIADMLNKAGGDLVSLSERIDTTTAAGKMVFRMMAVLNEFERDQISERTRMALAHRRAQGKKLGGIVPYGYMADSEGMLTKDVVEQGVIDRIVKRREQGWTLDRITRYLNGKDIPTKTGKQWYSQTVLNVIKDNQQ